MKNREYIEILRRTIFRQQLLINDLKDKVDYLLEENKKLKTKKKLKVQELDFC